MDRSITKKVLYAVFLTAIILSGCTQRSANESKSLEKSTELKKQEDQGSAFAYDYCFDISPKLQLSLTTAEILPAQFLESNPKAVTAINGPYYDKEGKTLGVVYLADGRQLGNKQGRKSGYFFVSKSGDKVWVDEKFSGQYEDYGVVLGTHPLLLKSGTISSQAKEDRYNISNSNGEYSLKADYRSAIGTKNGRNVCFAVSAYHFTMVDWAQLLKERGFTDALNLDGGPISQLAIRGKGSFGGGMMPTRLIIFAEER